MKKIYKLLTILAIPSILLLYSYSGGSPGGKTGSVGDEGNTCTDCHAGTSVGQIGWISSNIPEAGYTPGETYSITATGTHEGVVKFGFELTAENVGGDKLGGFMITDADRTKFTNANNAVTHTQAGNAPNGSMNTWSVGWTAPSGGEVIFNAAFNAANGNGGTTGDQIYTSSLNVNQSTVGIQDNLLAEKLKIYPNPASSYVILETPERSEFRIVNMVGQQMITKKNSNTSERIDISSLDQGIYFIQVMHEGNAATIRFLKN